MNQTVVVVAPRTGRQIGREMARLLSQLAEGEIRSNRLPKGAVEDARNYLASPVRIARMHLFGASSPHTHDADRANFISAWEAFRRSDMMQQAGESSDYFNRELLVLAEFLRCLDNELGPCSGEELKNMALRAASFFKALAEY